MLYVHAIKIHKLFLSLKNVIRREVTERFARCGPKWGKGCIHCEYGRY